MDLNAFPQRPEISSYWYSLVPSSPDQHKSGFFEHYPLYDDIFLRLNFVILFLVAVSPFLMQGFWISPDFVNPMSILYALDIMGVYAILGVLHQRYVWQNEDQLKVEEEREVKMDRNMQFITSVWFLISAVIPMQYRFVF